MTNDQLKARLLMSGFESRESFSYTRVYYDLEYGGRPLIQVTYDTNWHHLWDVVNFGPGIYTKYQGDSLVEALEAVQSLMEEYSDK